MRAENLIRLNKIARGYYKKNGTFLRKMPTKMPNTEGQRLKNKPVLPVGPRGPVEPMSPV